jgi:drug/metabolite transporter (DMT)-like permease
MIYLVLGIASMLTIGVMVKINELKGVNRQVVIASNYIVASLLGWSLVLVHGIDGIDHSTFLLGLGGGLLWPAAFYLQMWGIRRYGLSLAGTVSRLSLSIPVLFAILFLGERLTPWTGLGILGVFASFFLLTPVRRTAQQALDRHAIGYFLLLVLIFALGPLVWKERVTHGNVAGILVALAAIALLTLR